MPEPTTEPTLCERARTALAMASAATLVTRSCPPRTGTATVVSMEDQPDGRPLIRLEEASPTVRELGACRVATLSVAGPDPFQRLELTGPIAACHASIPGQMHYRLTPLACRLVGGRAVSLSVRQFVAARPDPLRCVAPRMLQHLTEAHTADLLACIRAHGYIDAETVVPRAVDRYGIELAVLCEGGVERVRLPFPGGPIDALTQVPQGLAAPLTCRCRGAEQA